MATSHVQVLVEFTKKLPGRSSVLGQNLLLQSLHVFQLPFGNRVYFEDCIKMLPSHTHALFRHHQRNGALCSEE